MAELGRDTSQLRHQKALMLIQFARNYRVLGNTGAQRARAEEAHRIMQTLLVRTSATVRYNAILASLTINWAMCWTRRVT